VIIFPAIDLKDGRCVRLKRGEMETATVFNDDPAAQARAFADAGFEWLHCVDLNGAFEGRSANAEAVKAIRANRNRPFFMYLAFNAPHTPLQAAKADYDALPQIKDHRLRVYGAMVRSLDRNIGRVLDELKAQGLDENTLVIFTSDNGGANYIGLPEINKPYRGFKATFFEGGVHVPFFVRWPKALPAGTRTDVRAMHIDIFPTVADAAGGSMAMNARIWNRCVTTMSR